MTTPRDKAIQTIAKLRTLAEHPNTGKPEADAARARIEALRTKHGISASPPPKAKVPYSDNTDWNRAADNFAREAKKAADAARVMAEAMRKAEAAAAYRKKMEDRDDMGRPRDIFDEALKKDKRTVKDRNSAIKDSFYRNGFCNPKESFYDRGGEPRKRNEYITMCEKCGGTLQPGDGAVMMVGGQWKSWCCERTPGPRRKRF